MKKIFLFALLFCAGSLLKAQELNSFFPQNNNLQKWFQTVSVEEKMREVQKARGFEIFDWVFSTLNQHIVYFAVLDFNNDGINDLLYNSYMGGESEHFILMKGDGNSYKIILQLLGRVVQANLPNENQPLNFAIYNYACCMGRVDFVEYYIPTIQVDNIQYRLQQREAFIGATVFPKNKFSYPAHFKTTKDKYNLRLEPKLDDESDTYWTSEEKGNSIAEYPKGSEGVALAEQTDSTGRTWWFVKMINNKPSLSMFMHGDNNQSAYFSYGWMSNRYLEISGKR